MVICFPDHGTAANGARVAGKHLLGVLLIKIERSSMRDMRQTEAISVISRELRF
jgi:hypothetical protein